MINNNYVVKDKLIKKKYLKYKKKYFKLKIGGNPIHIYDLTELNESLDIHLYHLKEVHDSCSTVESGIDKYLPINKEILKEYILENSSFYTKFIKTTTEWKIRVTKISEGTNSWLSEIKLGKLKEINIETNIGEFEFIKNDKHYKILIRLPKDSENFFTKIIYKKEEYKLDFFYLRENTDTRIPSMLNWERYKPKSLKDRNDLMQDLILAISHRNSLAKIKKKQEEEMRNTEIVRLIREEEHRIQEQEKLIRQEQERIQEQERLELKKIRDKQDKERIQKEEERLKQYIETKINAYKIKDEQPVSFNFDKEDIKFYDFYLKLSKAVDAISVDATDSLYYKLIINSNRKINFQDKIGLGNYNEIYLYNDGINNYAVSKQKKPNYNVNEILLLIYLNTIKLDSSTECLNISVFSKFINILFDFQKLEYYLCYKLYTSNLLDYLIFLNDKCHSHYIIIKKILEKITKDDLDKKFEKLLNINYICMDIKLENILVSYNKSELDYTEIVLHDFDLFLCCQKNIDALPKCIMTIQTKIFFEIYYKLIIYLQCLHYKYYSTSTHGIRLKFLPILLYQDYFLTIDNELLKSFFEYILQDITLVNVKDTTFKRIYYEFEYYIINGFLQYYYDSHIKEFIEKKQATEFSQFIIEIVKKPNSYRYGQSI